ncbi:hypothetical protein ISN45_At01g039780 [Arabidopsis thaliana x Arabidopsis arenosa]|uniref:Ribonuclease inhibitor n=3 Tax=Arabidopsis TaxID=3701 RepID=F4HV48_ARATH|nr:Ribonuclease inhibitor [Arabidopsis thaliana]AEE32224.1 Ribonuclease inhibitor [Arabidopsis thaliana]KAG7648889.1 hypothetical protein ISN45_At01g039780 [Arabidopsis thaliana x Arabidopsis arenosa]OAP13535.1 hypothetical protein AXX17_AT1G41940 [Arabidopsis thaliana]|eukprot:NP_175224.1 Ribonuclease inhibitor [Arabidopsis thaliana]
MNHSCLYEAISSPNTTPGAKPKPAATQLSLSNIFLGFNNNFTGEIPQSICGLNSLYALDLLDNNLHGSIPQCLETLMMSSLLYRPMTLASHKFSWHLDHMILRISTL